MTESKKIINYFHVAPASGSYHGLQPLTYACSDTLKPGQVVKITLRNKPVHGVIISKVNEPDFKTSEIDEALTNIILPKAHIDLLLWMNKYYPSGLGPLAQHFLPSFIDELAPDTDHNEEKLIFENLPALTDEQQEVLKKINNNKKARSWVLHGETGTGKTRVYIELANLCLSQKKSALILTPEIALTTPLIEQFQKVFGEDRIIYTHSKLSNLKRKKVWSKLFSGSGSYIIIGPRSALFMPVKNLGLIVVDESHDQAYKQESSPYYHALRVASKLSSLSDAKVLFGSATPMVSEYFLATQKNIPILRMLKPATSKTIDPSEDPIIIDLSDAQEKSAYPLISKSLIKQLENCLGSGHQSLLFLNKRGTSRTVICQSCGWRSICPNCDISLTYHLDNHALICHTCGFTDKPPPCCPECQSTDIIFKSPGTKAIQSSLEKIFPKAKIARFDRDNAANDRIERNYEKLVSGEIDIIIGTQLLTKGHDLPKLSLAAMLSADSGLEFPDYTSEERSFQLIRQLSGRVNRGHVKGKILLQTYEPNNPTISRACTGNYEDFYKQQLITRKKLGFPPFIHAMKVEVHRSTRDSAVNSIEKINSNIHSKKGIRIIGPAPSYRERRGKKYHWQIIVTSKDRSLLVDIATELSNKAKVELDPLHFL
jgi:primosomal protein N' (replication factor Y) (superfamily II helicase)